LIYTTLHESRCQVITANIAKQRPSDDWESSPREIYTLVGLFEDRKRPSQIVMEAGRYGVTLLSCKAGNTTRTYYARTNKASGHYDRPLAIFDVHPGEVVDVGKLVLLGAPSGPKNWLGVRPSQFRTAAAPIPEEAL
jgi:hypothetical protein